MPRHAIRWLHGHGQRLGLVPTLGGSVAAWRHQGREHTLDLWRPWSGESTELNRMACYPLVPWSNRIGGGGFEQDGVFHPIRPHAGGSPYPIHGDGWLQPWRLEQPAPDTMVMTLHASRFNGNPYEYQASQTFRLLPTGLDHTLSVRHLGSRPLPYGLGLHPWLPRTPTCRVQARVQAVWLGGPDRLPADRSADFPPGWNLGEGVGVCGSLIDHGYAGWDGQATLDWPERGLSMTVHARLHASHAADELCCVFYRPPEGDGFCFEPVTHPINAFHLPQRPGLRVLGQGEGMSLHLEWRFAVHP